MHGMSLLKTKKVFPLIMHFKVFLDSSERKPCNIWADQGSEFYNKSFKNG